MSLVAQVKMPRPKPRSWPKYGNGARTKGQGAVVLRHRTSPGADASVSASGSRSGNSDGSGSGSGSDGSGGGGLNRRSSGISSPPSTYNTSLFSGSGSSHSPSHSHSHPHSHSHSRAQSIGVASGRISPSSNTGSHFGARDNPSWTASFEASGISSDTASPNDPLGLPGSVLLDSFSALSILSTPEQTASAYTSGFSRHATSSSTLPISSVVQQWDSADLSIDISSPLPLRPRTRSPSNSVVPLYTSSSSFSTRPNSSSSSRDILETYRETPIASQMPYRHLSPAALILGYGPSHARSFSSVAQPLRYQAMDTPGSYLYGYGPPIPPSLLNKSRPPHLESQADISYLNLKHQFNFNFNSNSSSYSHANTNTTANSSESPSPFSFSPPAELGLVEVHTRSGGASPGPGTAENPRSVEPHPVLGPSPGSNSNSNNTNGNSSNLSGGVTAQNISFNSTINSASLPVVPEPAVPKSLYSSSFQFKIGASGSPKEVPPPPKRRYVSPAASRPLGPPRQRSFPLQEVTAPSSSKFRSVQVGEDAYFARPDAMCVADGVGGWAKRGKESGANASRWSRLLTHFCEEEVGKWWDGHDDYVEQSQSQSQSGSHLGDGPGTGPGGRVGSRWVAEKLETDEYGLESGWKRKELDPVMIMQKGYEKCLSCAVSEGIIGSSTCLIALLHHTTLHMANVGDCALLIIRDNEVVFRSTEGTHGFNHPMQLGPHSKDEPMKDANQWKFEVRKEDVVVMASDGLVDNMYDEDILEVLATFGPPSSSSCATHSKSQMSNSGSAQSSKYSSVPSSTFGSRPNSSGLGAGGIDTATGSYTGRSSLHSHSHSHTHTQSQLQPFDPQKVSDALCRQARSISEQTLASTPFMERAVEVGIDFVGGKKDGERESRNGRSGGMELRT